MIEPFPMFSRPAARDYKILFHKGKLLLQEPRSLSTIIYSLEKISPNPKHHSSDRKLGWNMQTIQDVLLK